MDMYDRLQMNGQSKLEERVHSFSTYLTRNAQREKTGGIQSPVAPGAPKTLYGTFGGLSACVSADPHGSL